MEEVSCQLQDPLDISNLSNGIKIKTEPEEDMEIKLEQLHHSIDIKDEIFESEVDEENENQISSQLECEVCNAEIHHGEIFQCNACDYQSSTKFHLKDHVRIHPGYKPFVCDICNCKFSQKRYWKKHMMTHADDQSSKVSTFVCEICNRKFKEKQHLSYHFSRIHAREKPRETGDSARTVIEKKLFTCEFCSYQVSHSGLLKAHLKRHSVEKLYACNICDRKFSFQYILNVHIRTHVVELEGGTEEKTIVCNICDRKFMRQSHFKNHFTRIHACENPRAREMVKKRSASSHSF